ncbi:A disintegrin and metalloproteinase with thrombospondin motifs 17-like [Saccoglossus kowalevskii]
MGNQEDLRTYIGEPVVLGDPGGPDGPGRPGSPGGPESTSGTEGPGGLVPLEEDGEWSLWTSWMPCSKTCGEEGSSLKSSSRECDNSPPSGDGKDCERKRSVEEVCEVLVCPGDEQYTDDK